MDTIIQLEEDYINNASIDELINYWKNISTKEFVISFRRVKSKLNNDSKMINDIVNNKNWIEFCKLHWKDVFDTCNELDKNNKIE